MQPLIDVQQGQVLQSGIYPSLAPNQQALWRDAENVLFVDGRVEKMHGWEVQHTYPTVVNALTQGYADSERRVYAGLPTELWVYKDGVNTRLGSGFAAGSRWSLVTWGTWLIATNNLDHVKVWKNGAADTAADLAGVVAKTITRAKIVRRLANFILLYNTSMGGQRVDWSDLSDPETWVPDVANAAGGITIRDLDGNITAAEPLGKVIAFYTEDSMGITEWIGGDSVFSNQVVLNGVGSVGQNAVTQVNNTHYGVSRRGIWNSDGVSYTYMDDPAVNRWLQANVDWTKGDEVVTVHLEARRMVGFFFKCLDGQVRGLGLNYLGKSWTKLKANVTAAVEAQVFTQPVFAIGTDLVFWDLGNDAGAAAVVTTLTTAFTDGGDRNFYKLWDKLVLEADVQGTFEVRFGYAETPKDSAITWAAWQPFNRELYPDQESPYLVVQFRSLTLGDRWAIEGFTLFGELSGAVG